MTATAMSPVTLVTVRAISGIASTPMSNPMASAGRPTDTRTGTITSSEPLGMPGALNVVTTAVSTTIAS